MSPVYINGVEQVVAHAAKHQDTGADEVSVAALSGELADRQKSKAGTSVLGWTDEKLLKGAGAGVAPDEIDVPVGGYTQGASVYHNAAQTTVTGAALTLAFNSERYDTDNIHDNAVNNSRLTCKTAGKYLITLTLLWAVNAAGFRHIYLILMPAGVAIADVAQPNAGAGMFTGQGLSTICQLAVNDYVYVEVVQDSGGNLDVLYMGNESPEFAMQRIG